MQWREEDLDQLPSKNGFRLRGLEMTRLETFTDAAFAFAITMLVISLSGIPGSVAELAEAMKGIPAFFVSFATIASFWYAHRQWSRRYGLEDGLTILISLGLIFVMLVYVYPLKMVFSALFYWISAGWFPSNFELQTRFDLPNLFVIYGLGFFALTGLICLLYVRALRTGDLLRLNELERLKTRAEMAYHGVLAATGFMSALLAWVLPAELGVWCGFVYMTLGFTMPIVAVHYEKRAAGL